VGSQNEVFELCWRPDREWTRANLTWQAQAPKASASSALSYALWEELGVKQLYFVADDQQVHELSLAEPAPFR
jgi:hypothetical protein